MKLNLTLRYLMTVLFFDFFVDIIENAIGNENFCN